MFFVYVIKSKEGYRYTGMTENLKVRLQQHNDHSLSQWTKRGTGWKVIYSETFNNKPEALKREKWLKGGYGKRFLKEFVSGY